MTGVPPRGGAALGWLYGFVRPHRGRLALVLALSLASAMLGLAQPYLTKLLIDDGLIAGDYDIVLRLCGILLLAAVAGQALGGVNRWFYVATSGRVLFALRECLYRHLQTLAPTFFGRVRDGDLLARIDGDVAEIQRFAVDTLLAAVNAVVVLIGTAIIVVVLSWQLALVAALAIPLQIAFLRFIRPHIERRTRTVRERNSDLVSFLAERIPAIKFIRSVGAEEREARRYRGLNEAYLNDLLRLEVTSFFGGAVPGLLSTAATAAVFLGGGWLVVNGQLSIGTLIAFSAYLARAMGPVRTLLGLYVAACRAKVSLDRVMEIMDARPAVEPPVRPVRLEAPVTGRLDIEDVTFAYVDGRPVLSGVTGVVPAGAKVGIIGPSGVGKTTLIDLLHRHYDPDAGRIALDGHDLRSLDPAQLRRLIAVVAQDTVVLAGSIAENIRYAAPEATDAEVRAAAERAGVLEFAEKLPGGLEARVGGRGRTLSGGQRQRIAIARALLQNPAVLVLDEATSAVDPATERRIAQAIDALFADRTRIVITHRHDSLADCSLVLVLEAGRFVAGEAKEASGGG